MNDFRFRGLDTADVLKDYPNVLAWFNACNEQKELKEANNGEELEGFITMIKEKWNNPVVPKE